MKRFFILMTLITKVMFANFDATIPVLDMNDYHNPETKALFLDELKNALCDVGFFAVVNTKVDGAILDHAYDAAEAFFALPMEEKMRIFRPECGKQRGYAPGESAKGNTISDCKEFLHVGREMADEDLKRLAIWKNVWPEDQDQELKETLCALFDALEVHKTDLETAFAEILGVEKDFFSKMTSDGDSLLRAIHYPANPPENQVWAAEHTDIDLFTILPRATALGLQVQNRKGEWITIDVPENAFIINAGDMLENVSNGLFKSGLHRVMAQDSNYDRYSMVLFIHPKAEDRLDPLPQCIEWTGGIQKFPNATRLELLEERLIDLGLASQEMVIHLAKSGLEEQQIELGRASPQVLKRFQEEGVASEAVLQELENLSQK